MKVVWFTNMLLPAVAEVLGKDQSANEGWLVGMASVLTHKADLELIICSPQQFSTEIIQGQTKDYRYVAYPSHKNQNIYEPNLKATIISILNDISPDVIHIMGSEKPHCYSIIEACEYLNLLNNTVISIQGMVSVYAKHYCLGLPTFVKYGLMSIRDLIKRDSPYKGMKSYISAGYYEEMALKKCQNIIGRTDWDKACTYLINPNRKYFFNNEVLRPSFYGPIWEIDKCEKHSIFMSQANYPIKGFHLALEAYKKVAEFYPDIKIYVAGSDALKNGKGVPAWRRSSYVNYIYKLIRDYGLENNIIFCGKLPEKQMLEQFLKSNVFVSASTIENSPNSVGEAMILGVPTISSNVGGVADLLTHGVEGLLYQSDAPYMLAYNICRVFTNTELANKISKNGIHRAQRTHSREQNVNQLYNIYNEINSR